MAIDMLDDRYGEIAETIKTMIQEDWTMVKMYAQIIDDSSMIFFYYYPSDGSDPVINLEIPGRFEVDKNEFRESKLQLWQQILSLSEEFEN